MPPHRSGISKSWGAKSVVDPTASVPFLSLLDSLVDLFSVHRNLLRRHNSKSHLLSTDTDYGHANVVGDAHGFACFSGEDQHVLLLDQISKRPVIQALQ
jgi:hypothetical protein